MEEKKEEFVFFFGADSPFSNWYPCTFVMLHPLDADRKISYNCSEQRMMHYKACMFGDVKTAEAIMKAKSPKTQKALGRRVEGYVDEQWEQKRVGAVTAANIAKFGQNPDLLKELLSAKGSFVEASPYDKIWGIGLAADSPAALDRRRWKGQNLLGQLLDKIRAEFIRMGFSVAHAGKIMRTKKDC